LKRLAVIAIRSSTSSLRIQPKLPAGSSSQAWTSLTMAALEKL